MFLIEVSAGELIDKLTILEIKLSNIRDEAKLANVRQEYRALSAALCGEHLHTEKIGHLRATLKSINERIWRFEDEIRDCERAQDFGPKFIELARSIYRTNDLRAATKREINISMSSTTIEEKSYAPY